MLSFFVDDNGVVVGLLFALFSYNERDISYPKLRLINPEHELALLANKIDWKYFEDTFKSLYSGKPGRPSMPIRFMVGVLMLKHLYSPGDERIPEYWVRDVYFQYFCGGVFFEHQFPCDPSDFVHFRRRIGEEEFQKIFAYSVHLHGKEIVRQSKFVLSDTTVQGDFTTFPTDAKMCGKMIDKCNKIAEREGIKQRCKYKKESKDLVRQTYNGKHPKRAKASGKAKKRLKTIANTQLREPERKMTEGQKACNKERLELYKRAFNQQKNDKNKVYNLHKPFTECIDTGTKRKKAANTARTAFSPAP